jgi:hypothetical protein
LIQKAEEAGARIFFGHALDVNETDFLDNAANGGGPSGSKLAFDVTSSDGARSRRYVNCSCPVLGCDGAQVSSTVASGVTNFLGAIQAEAAA